VSPRHSQRAPPPGPALASDLAIDLGTANTLVFAPGRGIVLNEPTVVAVNSRTQEVVALGREAWQMIGRTPGYIVAVRPVRHGAITDFEVTERLLRRLLERAGVSRLSRHRVLVCVPSAVTEVERRALVEAARRAGASGAHLIAQPMAAAIGAGLRIDEPLGNMIVDIGGGTTETTVLSLGGTVASEALRVGGFDIDVAIQTYLRREHGIVIGERTAEEVKHAIGSAWVLDGHIKAEVRGRDLMTGLAKTVILAPEEVRETIEEQVRAMVDSVVRCLAMTPPDLAQDLIAEGINMVGGGGLLRGLDRRLAAETTLPVRLVESPLECVVLGAGKCLEQFDAVRDQLLL
jgi:rod shape-determining protein MreB